MDVKSAERRERSRSRAALFDSGNLRPVDSEPSWRRRFAVIGGALESPPLLSRSLRGGRD